MTDMPAVSFEMIDAIAVATLCNPPVNAGSHDLRLGVLQALEQAEKSEALGLVITGAGSCFMAGSDLREFGQPLGDPQLPAVILALEQARFPVVAAMHGVALGGGLELALGCDYRIAEAGCKLGLPEVSLGMLPGAGGTQRLPRFTGIAKAIEMICGSKRIDADQALKAGFVDAVFDGAEGRVQQAIAFLAGVGVKRLAMDMPVPADKAGAIKAAEARALSRGAGRANVAAAIRLIHRAAEPDGQASLAEERITFTGLRLGPDAFALRHLFFAERDAGKLAEIDVKTAQLPASLAVIGAGTMGQGIGKSFLKAGFSVTFLEQSPDAVQMAARRLTADLETDVQRGRLSADQRKAWLSRVHWTADISTLADCPLVVEAVFEDMQVKQDLLRRLEAVLSASAVIATNTSYLDIDEMAKDMAHPQRLLGLHFFSPAHIMKLLEIVRAAKTSAATVALALAVGRKLGKTTVVAKVGEGFIGNRIYAAYRRRAELLVLEGASPQDVDAALLAFGFAMGVFAVSDMSGLDIAWAMRKRQAATRDDRLRYVRIPDLLCEAGRLGRKTGAGWYHYTDGKASVDPVVTALIDAERRAAGLTPKSYSSEAIQRQLMAAIVNEAGCVLAEGIARQAADIDVVLCNGYGFPRWRGGPMYWAQQQDRSRLLADIDRLQKAIGPGFKRGSLELVLGDSQPEKGPEHV